MELEYIEYSGKFYRVLHPRPTVILSTLCPNGKYNLMPASWNTPISEEPPTVGVVVDKETYTRECLEYHNEATINIPDFRQIDVTYALGSISGRSVDKISKYSIDLIESRYVKPPGIKGSIAILEATIMDRVEIGEVYFYIFKILYTKILKGAADQWSINFNKHNILLHGAGRVFHIVNSRKFFARKSI